MTDEQATNPHELSDALKNAAAKLRKVEKPINELAQAFGEAGLRLFFSTDRITPSHLEQQARFVRSIEDLPEEFAPSDRKAEFFTKFKDKKLDSSFTAVIFNQHTHKLLVHFDELPTLGGFTFYGVDRRRVEDELGIGLLMSAADGDPIALDRYAQPVYAFSTSTARKPNRAIRDDWNWRWVEGMVVTSLHGMTGRPSDDPALAAAQAVATGVGFDRVLA